MTAAEVIKRLDLKPLPGEGGFYRETYRSEGSDPQTKRNFSTAIYYLVIPESFSALHRVKSDEIFHFYAGDPVEMLQITVQGAASMHTLGGDVLNGETPQVIVPKLVWQGLKLRPGGEWALMGTTVSPGFEFEDFELGDRTKMVRSYPSLKSEIIEYTREGGG